MAIGHDLARLRALPLFAELDDAGLERVAGIVTEVEFPEGALLIERGQPGSGLFVLVDGRVRIDLPDRSVESGPGEFIGELSLLTGRTRTGRVSAVTHVRCLAIARADFSALLESEPRIALPLVSVLADRLADRIVDSGRR